MSSPDLDTREQRIWDAAYAAAFVQEYANHAAAYSRVDAITARTAAAVADLAVLRLRQWRESSDDLAGLRLPA